MVGQTGKQKDGLTGERLDGQTDVRMDVLPEGWANGVNGQVYGSININRWLRRLMDGRMEEPRKESNDEWLDVGMDG